MLTIIARILISEEDYRKAIVKGWADRFLGEVLDPADIQSFDDVGDFMSAVPHMSEDDFTDIGVVG